MAPPQVRDGRYFPETNFRVANDAFWNYFQSRGALDTFGFPVSRQLGFLGCQVQIFQRSVMRQCGDSNSPVALLNLLDPEIFPYTHVNGSVFPGPDDTIKNQTPVPGSDGYDQAIVQFVINVAPPVRELALRRRSGNSRHPAGRLFEVDPSRARSGRAGRARTCRRTWTRRRRARPSTPSTAPANPSRCADQQTCQAPT
jgi:hypothetical protein